MKERNKRAYPRVQARRGHHASFPGGSGGIRNVSVGGVMLNDPDPLLPGAPIRMNLHLGLEVVWCDGVVRRSETARGMAIEFANLAPIARSRIERYVMQLAAAANRVRLDDGLSRVASAYQARAGAAATAETAKAKTTTEGDRTPSIGLGELLVARGTITPAQLALATTHTERPGGQLPQALVRLGIVSEDDLVSLLAEQYRLAVVDLTSIDPTSEVLRLVPQALARRHAILPIGLGRTLSVAIADPTNLAGINEVKIRSGCTLNVALAPAKSLATAIDRFYGARARAAG
jgi:hypothetical protein